MAPTKVEALPAGGRQRRLVRLSLAAVVIAVTLGISWTQTTDADEPSCVLPKVDVAQLARLQTELAGTPAAQTAESDAGTFAEPHHLMDFPPPTGRTVDYPTAALIQTFLNQYTTCINAGVVAARYGVYTADFLRRRFLNDPSALADVLAAMGAAPVLAEKPVTCTLIRAWTIPSGHIVAVVQVTPDTFFNTLLLLQDAGRWKVDDRWIGQGETLLGELGTGPQFADPLLATPGADEDGLAPAPIPTRDLW